MADLGFAVGGGRRPRRKALTPEAVTFRKLCMAKWKNLDPWGAFARHAPRSANDNGLKQPKTYSNNRGFILSLSQFQKHRLCCGTILRSNSKVEWIGGKKQMWHQKGRKIGIHVRGDWNQWRESSRSPKQRTVGPQKGICETKKDKNLLYIKMLCYQVECSVQSITLVTKNSFRSIYNSDVHCD